MTPRDQRQFATVESTEFGFQVKAGDWMDTAWIRREDAERSRDSLNVAHNSAVREKVNEALEKTAATIESQEVFHFFMMPGLAGDKLKELAAEIRRMKEEG